MAYGNLLADVVQSSVTNTPTQFNDGTGTQIGTLCRAWVTFSSITSGYTIYGQFNVSSITRNATGDYTVNFTNALPNANYAAVTTPIGQSTTDSRGAMPLKGAYNGSPTLKTTTQCAFLYGSSSSVGLYDIGYGSCAFFC